MEERSGPVEWERGVLFRLSLVCVLPVLPPRFSLPFSLALVRASISLVPVCYPVPPLDLLQRKGSSWETPHNYKARHTATLAQTSVKT